MKINSDPFHTDTAKSTVKSVNVSLVLGLWDSVLTKLQKVEGNKLDVNTVEKIVIDVTSAFRDLGFISKSELQSLPVEQQHKVNVMVMINDQMNKLDIKPNNIPDDERYFVFCEYLSDMLFIAETNFLTNMLILDTSIADCDMTAMMNATDVMDFGFEMSSLGNEPHPGGGVFNLNCEIQTLCFIFKYKGKLDNLKGKLGASGDSVHRAFESEFFSLDQAFKAGYLTIAEYIQALRKAYYIDENYKFFSKYANDYIHA